MTGRRRPFPVPERHLPSDEAVELLGLVRDIAEHELLPVAAEAEERAARLQEHPRDAYRLLGKAGLLGLPYPEQHGGGGQPYVVYLQVLEELARCWGTVAMGVSVHVLACHALARSGSPEQVERWLPDLLAGDLLAAYCLSEAESGSDAAAMRTRAVRDGDGWVLTGTKAWITHAGMADSYTVFARTSPVPEGGRSGDGISTFLVPADAPGLTVAAPEHKMGFAGSRTAQVSFDGVRLGGDRLLGPEGGGFAVAKGALDAGRLGIAAVAVGLAQAALEDAVAYARQREQFGRPVIEHQGLGWMLADMATAVAASRALYLDGARLLDQGDGGPPVGDLTRLRAAASMAKTFCTDQAVRVTTDAVQVLGGAGYVSDHRAERLMREAKLLQIVEGTNQVQRVVVAGALARS